MYVVTESVCCLCPLISVGSRPVSRRTFAGFSRRVVKAAGENWDDVKSFNSALRRLEKRRATKVKKEGPLAESKIAWKIAGLQQALLDRIIELGESCGYMCNQGN